MSPLKLGVHCAHNSVLASNQSKLQLLGPVVPSFRALTGRLKFTVRRHKFNKGSLIQQQQLDARMELCEGGPNAGGTCHMKICDAILIIILSNARSQAHTTPWFVLLIEQAL